MAKKIGHKIVGYEVLKDGRLDGDDVEVRGRRSAPLGRHTRPVGRGAWVGRLGRVRAC